MKSSVSLGTRTLLTPLFLTLILLSTVAPSLGRDVPFVGTPIDNSLPGSRSIEAGDIDGDGDLDIIGGTTGTNGVVWIDNVNGTGSSWNTQVVDTTLGLVFDAAPGDIDGDGDVDIVAASNLDSDLAWFENDGSAGTWTRRDIDVTFGGASSVFVVDLNDDGLLDVLATGDAADDVTWFENLGGGLTWSEHTIDASFDSAKDAFPGDFDGDGDLDVVATGDFVGRVTWWENSNGAGTSWIERTIDASFSGGLSVFGGDLDGDGDMDVAAASEGGDVINWYENNGDGTSWVEEAVDPLFNGAHGVFAADIDGDGDLDLAGASRNDNDIVYYENVIGEGGVGNWNKNILATAFSSARGVAAADVDGDGDVDVLGASSTLGELAWWENETVHRSATFPIENVLDDSLNGARSVDSGDLDGDGDRDLVVIARDAGTVSWWKNLDRGISWVENIIATVEGGFGSTPDPGEPGSEDLTMDEVSVAVGDIDDDGDEDFVIAVESVDDVLWYENTNGDGSLWTEKIISTSFLGARQAVLADVDGDGDLDVLGAAAVAKDVTWFENDGNGGTWTAHIVEDNYDRASSVTAADIDGDGDLDVVGAADTIDDITWWQNQNGTGTMWSAEIIIDPNYSGAAYVDVADVDGDGDVDVLGAAEGGDEVTWWENDTPTVAGWPKHSIDFYNQALSVTSGDLDLDGDVDVVGTSYKDGGKVSWQENLDGDGLSWTEHLVTTAFDGAGWVELGDLDNDGDLDLMATAAVDDDLSVWRNRGGQFALATVDLTSGTLGNSTTAALLDVEVTHNGLAGEQDIELASLELLFEEVEGDVLTTSQANAIFENLFVYRDDGSGDFDAGLDTLVSTVSVLNLTDGVQTVTLTDGSPNVAISQGTPVTFFVAVETTADYSSAPLASFRVTHVTEASSTAEDADHDIELLLEFVSNLVSALVTVNPAAATADLVTTITDSPDPVPAGDPLVYTVTVTNNGPADALDVQVDTTLDADVGFVSTNGCGQDPAGSPTCDLGTITASSSKMFTVLVNVSSGASGTLSFTAAATSSTTEDNPGDESDVELTNVDAPSSSADLSITKTDSVDPVSPGGVLTYTLTVSNAGPDAAADVVITESLPGDVTLVSTSGCAEDPNGTPTCSLGIIPAGDDVMVTVQVDVDEMATGTLSNTASVASSTSDPNMANNSATEETTVQVTPPSADLSITKSDDVDPVDVGSNLTYTLIVLNNGPDDAENVEITDNLPSGVTLISTSGCNEDPVGIPTCSLGTIGGGNGVVVTVTVSVDMDAGAMLSNTASVTSTIDDPNLTNNEDTEGTVVNGGTPNADLVLDKTVFPPAHEPGSTLRYGITVTNEGPNDALGATVTDNFPSDVTGVSWTCVAGGGASCGNASGSGNIAETVDLPVGGIVTFVALGTVNGSVASIDNTATTATPGGVDDPDLLDNSDTVNTVEDDVIFADGFESGDLTSWSSVGSVTLPELSEGPRGARE